MPAIKLASACLALLLFSGAAAAGPAYQPFPAGYGYLEPVEVSSLEHAVQQGDIAVIRDHGWRLWAGIMQPAVGLDWPVWYTWPNTTDAFASPATLTDSATEHRAVADPARHRMGRLGASTLPVDLVDLPIYPVPKSFVHTYPNAAYYPKKSVKDPHPPLNIRDGAHFAFNGDIMIATESLSKEALDFIRDPLQPVYLKKTLDGLYSKGAKALVHELNAPASYVVTKHMYWPVKATGLTALPVWTNNFPPDYRGYAGYEMWKTVVAIDPSGTRVGQTAPVQYLYGVQQGKLKHPMRKITKQAKVYGLQDFYYHQVTQADWDSFDEADKAIINAASHWLNNQRFGVGDYLVTVAMHINTKEIPTWGLQSVWWSDHPDDSPYAANRPADMTARGPWNHYLLTDAYGIPEKNNSENKPARLPVATNPYIELVIHPVGTSCYTCHARAGWPSSIIAMTRDVASYQNRGCPDLRAVLHPDSGCLAPLTLTDFQWIIPDRAIDAGAKQKR